MTLKCENCKFYSREDGFDGEEWVDEPFEYCGSVDVLFDSGQANLDAPLDLDNAREICNREGDGRFVYFEERDPEPSAGAAFVQITREKSPPQAFKAAA